MEKPLFSPASMLAAASESRSAWRRNQRTSLVRTRSVSAARSAGVTGLAGRNATPWPSGRDLNRPSVTQAWRWTWRFKAEPKRWRKETAPSRGRRDGRAAASGTATAAPSHRSISSRKIRFQAVTAAGRSARMPRKRFGTEITHCLTGTGGMTRSARCAAENGHAAARAGWTDSPALAGEGHEKAVTAASAEDGRGRGQGQRAPQRYVLTRFSKSSWRPLVQGVASPLASISFSSDANDSVPASIRLPSGLDQEA